MLTSTSPVSTAPPSIPQVAVLYKNGESAKFAVPIFQFLPSLFDSGAADADVILTILKTFILATARKEVPELRERGLWKRSSTARLERIRSSSAH
jgi:hypothetical protein